MEPIPAVRSDLSKHVWWAKSRLSVVRTWTLNPRFADSPGVLFWRPVVPLLKRKGFHARPCESHEENARTKT